MLSLEENLFAKRRLLLKLSFSTFFAQKPLAKLVNIGDYYIYIKNQNPLDFVFSVR